MSEEEVVFLVVKFDLISLKGLHYEPYFSRQTNCQYYDNKRSTFIKFLCRVSIADWFSLIIKNSQHHEVVQEL